MASLFNLAGKTALITGGTRGIGRAAAIALAEAGADIILVQRNNSNTETQTEILTLGRQCSLAICDLSSTTSVSTLIPSLVSKHPRIDILINCAGIQRRHPAHEFPNSYWHETIQVNLSAVFTLCRDIANHWITNNQRGRIINFASLKAFQGGIDVSAYVASKHGVVGLTKSFADEWAGKGIAVNAIAPGYVETDMTEHWRKDEALQSEVLKRIPQERWGTPEDFKGPVLFLASEKASGYVNGECLVVDGGWMGR